GVTASVFNYLLGESGVTFCAKPRLAATLRRGFPKSLDGAPALLPMSNSGLRRSLEKWFHAMGIRPRLVGEFEDPGLVNVLALHGLGFISVPTIIANELNKQLGFQAIGQTTDCQQQFYAITPERKLSHPAVSAITSQARASIQSQELRPQGSKPLPSASLPGAAEENLECNDHQFPLDEPNR
ncbi:MAG TPA: LysR substrate-binding domain-containing protein, partial [Clostridia bacterium]|nr:LysR substrate-binding domain-containing protein [Clostridia bacterium]